MNSLNAIFCLDFCTQDAVRNASINPDRANNEKWGHRNKPICRGLFPHFSLLALSGLMEALRTASCVQKSRQKIAFKLSLISTRAELPITSSAGISVQPEAARLTPGEYD